MKYVLTAVFLLVIFLTVSSFSISPLYAQDASPSSTQKITYDMPYPGLLPDNPLYFFKTFRDRVVSMLIADSRKRVEFDLLNSDKRMSAGIALIMKGKDVLGLTTVSKSNNYFYEALSALQKAKSMGQDISLLVPKLRDAAAKHKEMLMSVEKKVSEKQKAALKQELSRLQGFSDQIVTYLPK